MLPEKGEPVGAVARVEAMASGEILPMHSAMGDAFEGPRKATEGYRRWNGPGSGEAASQRGKAASTGLSTAQTFLAG